MTRIAILDDDETWCFALATFLRRNGFEVETFTDAPGFLNQVIQFDVVLTDYLLPHRNYQQELNGPAIIAQLKERLPNPPILILMSSYFDAHNLDTIRSLFPQADLCLSKQIGVEAILQQIEQFIARPGSRPEEE